MGCDRFKLYTGDTSSVDDLAAWVDAAVGGCGGRKLHVDAVHVRPRIVVDTSWIVLASPQSKVK